MVKDSDVRKPPPVALNLIFASIAACTATGLCHPLDVARVRAMVKGGNQGWFTELIQVGKKEGVAGLWTGLSAGLLRQMFYGATRFGAFESLQDWRKASLKTSSQTLSPTEKVACALTAGALAGLVGNPPDVALTRMASDAKLPAELRRNYRNGFDAMIRIGREEGFVRGLMCGVSANVQRSVLVNGVMLGTYAQSREEIQRWTGLSSKSAFLTFLAGNVSGAATALFAVPADFVKTKLQYTRPGEFAGPLDVVKKTLATRGVLGMWAGFWPFWAKLAPHTTVSFMVIETLREFWSS